MKVLKKEGVKVLRFNNLSAYHSIEHCFTTRVGGRSRGSYNSLNMGFNTGDDLDTVKENYKIVVEAIFDSSLDNMVLSDQIHKTEIAIVDSSDRGRGLDDNFKYLGIDGLLTDKREVVLSTVYADCTPLFFFDPARKVVGVAHAGWRGTVGKIGKKMVQRMVSEYRSKADDILVGIGPTIGPCCYQIGEEVYHMFKSEFDDLSMIEISNGRIKLDLWEANKVGLMEVGIAERNIEIGRQCSSCNPELFYSYRRDGGVTGRMAGIVKLK